MDLSRFRASKELPSLDTETGWFVGIKFKTRLPLPNLGFDAAVLYNQSELDYVESTEMKDKKLHAFAIPINLRYNWEIGKTFGLYIATGPQWNVLVDKVRIGNIGKLEHVYFDWNVGMGMDLFRHVQFGFNYNIPLGKMGEVNSVNLEGHTWNIRLAYFF